MATLSVTVFPPQDRRIALDPRAVRAKAAYVTPTDFFTISRLQRWVVFMVTLDLHCLARQVVDFTDLFEFFENCALEQCFRPSSSQRLPGNG
jgi:hypothetical protein